MIIKIIYDLISANHNNLRHLCSIKNLTLGIFFAFAINLFPQTILKIEISGNKIFSESDYLSWINISSGQKYFNGIEDSLKAQITSALNDRGYYNFSFNNILLQRIDSTNALLRINIEEGKLTFINKISVNNPVKDSLIINNILSQLEKEKFVKSNIESVFSEIIDHYENIGFPFAVIKIESVEFITDSTSENHFVNLYVSVDAGTKSNIDRIEIAGNTKTKDCVIIRALQISLGENYSQNIVDVIPEKLNRLRFFEPVEQPEFFFDSKNKGVLKITVKEKETNFFDGIAGYVPAANDKEKGYLTGFINVNMRNLFGTGRTAYFRWQQENRFSQELELRYLEPWLFGFPFNLEGRLFQRKQDSTYVQRNFEGRLEFLATSEISASVLISTQSTIPSEQNENIFTVYNSSAFTSGVNLRIDSRDDYYSPTEGIFFNNTYSYSSKKINGPANFIASGTNTNITLQRLEFDFQFFNQFFNRQVAMLGIHGRELRGDDVEVSDLYFLGGTNSLRGYREKQFQGNRVLWSNLEYRLLLTRRSFAFLFFDTGYFLRNEDKLRNIPGSSSFKVGYGFGLNIETGLGVLSVSFALAKGDSFGEGKIHFGIINEF